MMSGNFTQPMVEDKARQRTVRDVALLESEWPAHTPAGVTSISGYATPNSGSASLLLSIPSSMWFKPRTLIVDNTSGVQGHILFTEGGSTSACSGVLFPMYVDARTTVFIGLDCITCGKDLWVNPDGGGITVKIGGILLPSGPEQAG